MNMEAYGLAMTRLLAGSWRDDAAPISVDESCLLRFASFFRATGSAGLVANRLRGTPLAATNAAVELQHLFRMQAIHSVLQERQLADLFTHLREKGLEPILMKGWASGRLYPEPALRPTGDIDLALPPGDLERAREILTAGAGRWGDVDLHAEVPDLPDRAWKELWRRSRVVRLGAAEIRVLSPEDHLRQLCLHMLRHEIYRPVWLCDVAVALETLGVQIDWDYLQDGDARLHSWVKAGLRLAVQLLQPRVAGLPHRYRRNPPDWLRRNVLAQWGRCDVSARPQPDPRAFRTYFAEPKLLWHGIRQRWPNRLEAMLKMGVHPQSSLPIWSIQFAAMVRRAFGWAGRGTASPHALTGTEFVSIHSH